MKVWVLHIKTKQIGYDKDGKKFIYKKNEYSVWNSKEQGYKEIKQFIKSHLNNWNSFYYNDELKIALVKLLEIDAIDESIKLINKYSSCKRIKEYSTIKFNITLIPSTFLGSPLL